MKTIIKSISNQAKSVAAAFLASFMLITIPGTSFAQEEEEKDNRPIRDPFGTTILIDNQTTVNLAKGSLGLEIAHRFSQIKEISDLYGIYGSANTRLALDYGITDRIMVGFGSTKDYKLQDFSWKVNLLTQTRSYSMPVSLSYYGNMVIDARSDDNFGPADQYSFAHRMSYLTQLIASSNFGKVSLQVIPTFAWYNGVPDGYNNINYGISFGGRAQVLGRSSIIFEYDQPISEHEALEVYPNCSLGIEVGTGTHFFRVFVANYSDIVKQQNMFFNTNKAFSNTDNSLKANFRFGFNISVALR